MEFAVTFSRPENCIEEQNYKKVANWIMNFSDQTRRPMIEKDFESMSVLPENMNIDINQQDKVSCEKTLFLLIFNDFFSFFSWGTVVEV